MSSALRPIYSQGDISECIFNNHPLVMREGMHVSECALGLVLVCLLVFSFTLSPSFHLVIVFDLVPDCTVFVFFSVDMKICTNFHCKDFTSRY